MLHIHLFLLRGLRVSPPLGASLSPTKRRFPKLPAEEAKLEIIPAEPLEGLPSAKITLASPPGGAKGKSSWDESESYLLGVHF